MAYADRHRIDLWYPLKPGFSKDELIDDLRENGIVIVKKKYAKGTPKRDIKLGIEAKAGYLNVSGQAIEVEKEVRLGGSPLARLITKDIMTGMRERPKVEAKRYMEPMHFQRIPGTAKRYKVLETRREISYRTYLRYRGKIK